MMALFGQLIAGLFRYFKVGRGNPGQGGGARRWRYSLTLIFAANRADMPIMRGTEYRRRGRWSFAINVQLRVDAK
ncbi:hypothetical protein MO867_21625 [Microbulbifer sp. OS29]|uniref:Uncharacterized protein n=1 Tax=Microbulbifer okhotskensis TaxID=2926617 RepID=A0A9X2J9S8_9GAMM|nr:hypothetical protein [Microbulbifer okhotskensis]MCO1336931.1 hypothetical protein [Microbulbifer okhotskensis]